MRLFLALSLLAVTSVPAMAQAPAGAAAPNTPVAGRGGPATPAPMDHVLVIPASDQDKVMTVKRLLDGGDFSVNLIHRKAGDAEGALVHKFTSEVYVVEEGSATLLTGGHLMEPVTGPPDQRTSKGGIVGGTTQEVKAGDVVFVPAGVPHVFSAYAPSIKYLNIRFQDPKYVGN